MCLALLGLGLHPRRPLVLLLNRDDYYQRPTHPAEFWIDHPQVLAGRDERSGGTWAGMTTHGRFGFLTNFRAGGKELSHLPSRGDIVKNFLAGQDDAPTYLRKLDAKRYAPFNIVLGDSKGVYYSSRDKPEITNLTDGLYGLSNAFLDVPWPKVERGKARAKELLTKDRLSREDLLNLLQDRKVAPDSKLPDTGIGLETERVLSPIFVDSPGYGTRTSTLIILSHRQEAQYVEVTYRPGTRRSIREFRFHLTTST